jgi:hypothetical protein
MCHTDPMATEWIGETTYTPSYLGPVPEFGPNGESPPLRTEPVAISWALITSGPPLTERELLEGLAREYDFGLKAVPEGWDAVDPITQKVMNPRSLPGKDIFSEYAATKRIVYRQYWQRDDPVLQLVPGETQSYSVRLKTGLTDQVLTEFSSTLGIKGKVSVVELSAQLSGRFSRTVTISTELQTTVTKQLTNTSNQYMRVAVWHVVHSFPLYRPVQSTRIPYKPAYSWKWEQFQDIEFADMAAPQSSSFPRPRLRLVRDGQRTPVAWRKVTGTRPTPAHCPGRPTMTAHWLRPGGLRDGALASRFRSRPPGPIRALDKSPHLSRARRRGRARCASPL